MGTNITQFFRKSRPHEIENGFSYQIYLMFGEDTIGFLENPFCYMQECIRRIQEHYDEYAFYPLLGEIHDPMTVEAEKHLILEDLHFLSEWVKKHEMHMESKSPCILRLDLDYSQVEDSRIKTMLKHIGLIRR